MRSTVSIPLLAAMICGCNPDVDGDSFSKNEDCDDRNAAIHPDAPEAVGDGVDSNCDGSDPDHPIVGTWTLDPATLEFSYGDPLVGGNAVGGLAIASDLRAAGRIFTDNDRYGFDWEGTATIDNDGAFELDMPGTYASLAENYASVAKWECELEGDSIHCEGPTSTTRDYTTSNYTTVTFTR